MIGSLLMIMIGSLYVENIIIICSLGKTTVYNQPSDGEAQPQRQHFQPGEENKTISKVTVFQTKLDCVRKCHDQSKGDPMVI